MVRKKTAIELSALLALTLLPVPIPTAAQPAERRIDGGSADRFEASVVSMRNELPARRREDLDVALAIIWARNTVGSDFDGDGDLDVTDMRLLEEYADDLLTNIRRGNVVSAIQDRSEGGDYTTADYFDQLDGLSYDEVVELGGLADAKSYLAAVQELGIKGPCTNLPGSRVKQCDGPSSLPRLSPRAGAALGDAIAALNERDYGAARDAIEELPLERLTSYERGKAEQILFTISAAEGSHADARRHLVNAIETGGLTADEVADALGRIRLIDAVAVPQGSSPASD